MSHILRTVGVSSITDVSNASKSIGVNCSGSTDDTQTVLIFNHTANRNVTFPDATTTVVGTDTTQTITNKSIYDPTSTTITAAGTNQATATPLTNMNNVVTTTPVGTGVVLFVPATNGIQVVITNRGANSLNLYPALSGQIDASGVNVPISIPSGETVIVKSATTTQWYTIKQSLIAGNGILVSYGNGQTSFATNGNLDPCANFLSATLQTTNATITTAITLPSISNTAYILTGRVLGLRSDRAASVNFIITASFVNNSGTLRKLGADDKLRFRDGSLTYDCRFIVSGTDILLQVIGVAATTINWRTCLEYHLLTA
jgi:hypothetical protein